MAKLFQAVSRYGPRVDQGGNVQLRELCDWMARSSGLNPNGARMALGEVGDGVAFYLRLGSPVVLPGLGRLRLTADRYGELRLNFVADKGLLLQVLNKQKFSGTMINAPAGHWTDAQYKEAWDAEFPDDPLELPAPRPRRVRHIGPGRPMKNAGGQVRRKRKPKVAVASGGADGGSGKA